MYLQTQNRRDWLRDQMLSRRPYKHKDASGHAAFGAQVPPA
jgi:hypothetical protein